VPQALKGKPNRCDKDRSHVAFPADTTLAADVAKFGSDVNGAIQSLTAAAAAFQTGVATVASDLSASAASAAASGSLPNLMAAFTDSTGQNSGATLSGHTSGKTITGTYQSDGSSGTFTVSKA
jgi:hypothetical protein